MALTKKIFLAWCLWMLSDYNFHKNGMVIETAYIKIFIVKYMQAKSLAEVVMLRFGFERTSKSQLYHCQI